MTKNNTSSDYWRGYRAVRIYALLNAVDGYNLVKGEVSSGKYSEAFLTGFDAGMKALEKELRKLIAHEKALEKGDIAE